MADKLNVFGNCDGCPFKGATCGSRGPIDSPIVIVGESPGKTEIKEGRPFAGISGQLLESIISKYGVEPYITNAFKCHPPQNKKDQGTLAIACRACHSKLDAEIRRHPRKVILALGAGAIWSLTGDYSLKITSVRGKLFKSDYAEHGIVAAVHPAFLLRGNGSLPKFKDDVMYAYDLLAGKPPKTHIVPHYSILTTDRQVEAVRKKILRRAYKQGSAIPVASDLETSGFCPVDDYILLGGLCYDPRHVYILPEELIKKPTTAVKNLMELPEDKVRWVWHNGKFDNGFLQHNGINSRVDEDTVLLSYALDETKGMHDLEQVSKDLIGAPDWKGMLEEYLPYKGASYAHIPAPVLTKYAAYDISNTLQDFFVLRERVAKDAHLEKLYTRTLIPASELLVDIELQGLRVDVPKAIENENRILAAMEEPKEILNRYARKLMGTDINPNSSQQMCVLLYDKIKIPVKKERSTDKKIIAMLPRHPAVVALTDYRRLSKAYSTYVRPLIPPKSRKTKVTKAQKHYVHSDGKVHSTYLLHGTVTGRLASRNPNLQNIPRDPHIRSQFIADPGHVFIEADLNQAELRCLAELSGDPVLMEIYLKNEISLHDKTTQAIYGKPSDWTPKQVQYYLQMFGCAVEDIPGEQKMRAKAVNFGIVYGREAPSLAEEFKLPVYETERWIQAWATTYSTAWNFIQRCRNAPNRGQVLITPFGRKRRFGIVTPENKQTLENEAANFPHQSIASDINITAARKTRPLIRPWGVRIANLVHDSTLLHAPLDPEVCLNATKILIENMENEAPNWGLKKVPFKADFKIGTAWGSLEKCTFEQLPERIEQIRSMQK